MSLHVEHKAAMFRFLNDNIKIYFKYGDEKMAHCNQDIFKLNFDPNKLKSSFLFQNVGLKL